jgi:hypothetical protein
MNLSSKPLSNEQEKSSWPSEPAAWYTVGLLFVAYTFTRWDTPTVRY